MPVNLREHQSSLTATPQNTDSSLHKVAVSDLAKTGSQFLSTVYGTKQGSSIEEALFRLSPNLGIYSVAYVYGGIYADTSTLSVRDVSPT